MSKSSLSSVVSDLVRAQMGSSVAPTVMDDDLDRHVAELILKEAKQKAEKYRRDGIHAYLARSIDSNAPKTNKRFLSSIIRSTDDHNKSILRAKAIAAQESREEREEQERSERRARAEEAVEAERLRRRKGKDRDGWADNWDRERRSDGKRRDRSWERDDREGDDRERRNEKRERRHRHRSRSREEGSSRHHQRSHRSRSRSHRTSRRQGDDDDDDREHRRDRDRDSKRSNAPSRVEELQAAVDHKKADTKDTLSHEDELRASLSLKRKAKSKASERSPSPLSARSCSPSRDHSRSPSCERTRKSSRRSPSRSRSRTPVREHRPSHRKRRRVSRSPTPTHERHSQRERDRERGQDRRHRSSRRPTTTPTAPTMSGSSSSNTLPSSAPSRSRSPSVGPSSPGPPSKMDKYFEQSYDPRLDVAPLTLPTVPATGLISDAEFAGWDAMLELIRLRRQDKEDKKAMERWGISSKDKDKDKDKVKEQSGEVSALDIKYKKRGAVREWDMGKEGF
ncbi:hypothetical protein C8Q80DRAFT_1264208 [Daedaleopsis nitida]|nr:hypothetical protein C8Q80DRAFT_1264208 [Daedaleopsis nitida]